MSAANSGRRRSGSEFPGERVRLGAQTGDANQATTERLEAFIGLGAPRSRTLILDWLMPLPQTTNLNFTVARTQREPADAVISVAESLYREHRWFQLRNLANCSHLPAFYRGAVACAFNNLALGEKCLRSVIKSAPHSSEAWQAHALLNWAHVREADFSRALA